MYLFLFGRNSELSKAELLTNLDSNQLNYRIVKIHHKFLVIDMDETDIPDISTLGGVLRIAEVYGSFRQKEDYKIAQILDELQIYEEKVNIGISSLSIDSEIQDIFKTHLKLYLKSHKIKVKLKHSSKNVFTPSEYWENKLDLNIELIVARVENDVFVAKSLSCTDPKEYHFRDEARPSRVFTHGTSPRTAQQLVNLLGDLKGKTVVDPFCGTGTLMIEAMLAGANAIGVDNDPSILKSAKQNLNWAKFEYNLKTSYQVILSDSKELSKLNIKADYCVFEPYMGPFLKDKPRLTQAIDIVENLKYIYTKVFENLYHILPSNTKVVCIIPSFPTKEGKTVDIGYGFFELNNFRFMELPLKINNPMPYKSAEGSIINRSVYVLEKDNAEV